MAANRIFLGIVLLGVTGGAGVFSGGGVGERDRNRVLKIACAEVGVREVGVNDGKRVREYLAYTGIKVPAAWCASFVSFCFHKAGYDRPRTAWSPALFPASRSTKDALPGNVFGIYYESLKRIGHCGILEQVKGEWCTTLEGNSNDNGSRNGDGVYRRMRHKRTVSKFADWIISKQ